MEPATRTPPGRPNCDPSVKYSDEILCPLICLHEKIIGPLDTEHSEKDATTETNTSSSLYTASDGGSKINVGAGELDLKTVKKVVSLLAPRKSLALTVMRYSLSSCPISEVPPGRYTVSLVILLSISSRTLSFEHPHVNSRGRGLE